MFHSTNEKDARKKRDAILQDYMDIAPKAMDCLDFGFESAMTVFYLPESVRKLVRTSNYIERLNKELKRRSNAIGVFPNGESVVRLVGALLVEYHEKLQGKKREFYTPRYNEIVAQNEILEKIAKEQEKLLAA